jgi:membrane fusion protein (multidrug efflux system)
VAKATLQAAQARLEQASLNLEYTAVKAPFDGVIGDTPFSVGTLLSPESGVLARVVKADPVEVTFGISDKVMASARLGDPRSGLPGSTVSNLRPRLVINNSDLFEGEGRIVYVAPEVDRQTDTIKFKARFDNPGGTLAPGQSVTVRLEPVDPPTVLLIPKNAVMTAQGESYVYVTAPDPANPAGLVSQTRPIKVGFEYEDGYEVLEGLSAGDKIIELGLMSGGARLRPGAPVVIASPEAAATASAQAPAAGQGAAGDTAANEAKAPEEGSGEPSAETASGGDPAGDGSEVK